MNMFNLKPHSLNSKSAIQKAQQNLNVAKILIERDHIALSAFHTQQCIELAIKAVVLKFQYNDVLQNTHYFNSHQIGNFFLVGIHNFVKSQFSEMSKELEINPQLNQDMCKALSTIEISMNRLKNLNKGQKNEEFFNTWKYSLGITTNHEIITALESYKESFGSKLSQRLCIETVRLLRAVCCKIKHICKKTRNMHKFKNAINDIKKKIIKINLSADIVDAFFDSEEKYNQMIAVEINKHGVTGVIDMLLGPHGLLSVVTKEIKLSKELKSRLSHIVKFICITYIVTISPIVILLYPHVIIGRYPMEIESKNLDSTTTEELYLQNKSNVQQMLTESEETLHRLTIILKSDYD